MELLYIGLTLGTLGKIILGVAVIRTHSRIGEEHKIDGVVLRAIIKEKYITAGAIALIAVGYFLEMWFYAQTPLIGS